MEALYPSPAEIIGTPQAQEPTGFRDAVEQFSDVRWRLNNLYFIVDKHGKRVPFRMNWGQLALFDNLHYLNLILKARQIGFSTFIQILMLDQCVFTPNVAAGTIADTRENAEKIFQTKAKYPYDNLPDGIKAANPATMDSARQLLFANNSNLLVGTSLRSGTYQYLHVSEYGKICAAYPEKAKEVRTGALNTVQAGQFVFVESTAEGQDGDFFEMCQRAQTLQRRAIPLSPMDFRYHFFPWWREPGYVLDPTNVEIPEELEKYFADLKESHGIELTAAQKAWYAKKEETQHEDIFKEFPSTPDEAFRASVEGSIFGKWIHKAERDGRITRVLHDPSLMVDTWWDLGRSIGNEMAVIFYQRVGTEPRFIDYYENVGEDLPHYARMLQEKQQKCGYVYGRHSWPHDGGHVRLGMGGKSLQTQFWELGFSVEVQPCYDIASTINVGRQFLSHAWFDAVRCEKLLNALRNYKYQRDELNGAWKKDPLHNWASNGGSAFRCGAMTFQDHVTAATESRTVREQRQRRERYVTRPQRRGSIWAA